MEVFLFCSSNTDGAEFFKGAVKSLIPEEDLKPFDDLARFRASLNRPLIGNSIVLVWANDMNELLEISEMVDIFRGKDLVLVLPDQDSGTARLGHSLLPRYMCHVDSDLRTAAAVINRLVLKAYRTFSPGSGGPTQGCSDHLGPGERKWVVD